MLYLRRCNRGQLFSQRVCKLPTADHFKHAQLYCLGGDAFKHDGALGPSLPDDTRQFFWLRGFIVKLLYFIFNCGFDGLRRSVRLENHENSMEGWVDI